MKRRHISVRLCAAWVPVGLLLAGCATARTEVPDEPIIGAQLYTVRAAMERDVSATLRQVAEMGYDAVEFAGLFGEDPAALCREVRELGMTVGASHVDWRLLRDDPAAAIAQTRALCSPVMVLAWLPPEERRTLDQWREWVDHLNRAAALAEAAGIRLAYHNHDFEFAPIDGVRPIDLLLDGLDPERATFELDVYWAAKAGVDPVEFLRAHRGRVTLLHLKDMAVDGAMADVGAGAIDFPALLAEAGRQGIRHGFVERDDAPAPWVSLARSLDYLERMALRAPDTPKDTPEIESDPT